MATLNQVLSKIRGRKKKLKNIRTKALQKHPQRKEMVVKVLTMTPKKPNSAIRKIAKVKLYDSNKIITAYIPGEGHKLTQYAQILIRGGRTQDLPGLNFKIIRGVLDCKGVIRSTSRS